MSAITKTKQGAGREKERQGQTDSSQILRVAFAPGRMLFGKEKTGATCHRVGDFRKDLFQFTGWKSCWVDFKGPTMQRPVNRLQEIGAR